MNLFPFDPEEGVGALDFAQGLRSDFAENFDAAYDEGRDLRRTVSRHELMMRAYAPLALRLNGGDPNGRWQSPYGLGESGMWMDEEARAARETLFFAEIERRRKLSPRAWAGAPRDAAQLAEQVSERVRQVQAEAQEVGGRRGWTGFAGGLAGSIAGGFDDPVNLLSVLFSLGAAPHMSVVGAALTEAGVGAAATLAQQPQIAADLEKAGIEVTTGDVLAEVGGAALGGAVLGGGASAIAKGLGAEIAWTPARARAAVKKFDNAVKDPTAEQRAARDALDQIAVAHDSNPGPDTDGALDGHIARLDALARLGDPDLGPDLNAVARPSQGLGAGVRIGPAATAAPAAPPGIEEVDPSGLAIDAKRFQFKAGGDGAGVTERLRGVTRWDPMKAGVAIVWEDAGGQRFIVDGHQRVGLARAIAAADPSQKPRLAARVMREADGVSAEDAMIAAAMKNIAEGTGTGIDAAKVFRLDPARLNDPSLPRASALIRQGRALAQLEPASWGMVVNDLVAPEHAALVANAIPDDAVLQRATMQLIHKLDPQSATEAQALIAQAKQAGATQEIQGSLFGDEVVAASLYEERMKVLARAVSQLRREGRIFGQLIAEASTIEAAGNRLASATNAELKAIADQGVSILIAAANRKGALSDALTEAARAARDSGRYDSAVKGFVGHVRSATARGDLNGDRIGDAGLDADLATQAGGGERGPGEIPGAGAERDAGGLDAKADAALAQFAEPGGAAQSAQTDGALRDLAAVQAERNANPPPEETVVNPIDPALTPEEKVAALAELTKQTAPLLDALTASIDAAFGTTSRVNVKLPDRILAKAARPSILARKPWFAVEHVRDSLRFKTVLDDFRQLPAILDLVQRSGFAIVKADTAKMFAPEAWGWRIAAFDLRAPTGQLVEYYLPVPELEAAKKAGGHLLFEKWRNRDLAELTPAELQAYHRDVNASFETYSAAWSKFLARTSSDETALRAAAEMAEASLPNTGVKSLFMSPTVIEGSPARQTPFSNAAAKPSSPSTISLSSPGSRALNTSIIDEASTQNIGAAQGPPQDASTALTSAENGQTVIPGAEALDPNRLAQALSDAGLKPKAPQQGLDGLSLFDPTARDTTGDLFAPLEVRDVDGVPAIMGKTLTQMEAEAQADMMFVNHLKTCGE